MSTEKNERKYSFTLVRVGAEIQVRNYQETFQGKTYDRPQTEEGTRIINDGKKTLVRIDRDVLEVRTEVPF